MRELVFNVQGQLLRKDPGCDFDHIVAGSANYLQARFQFDDEWKGRACVAKFEAGGKEVYVPLVGNACKVPESVTPYRLITVKVIGKRQDVYTITSPSRIAQIGGR